MMQALFPPPHGPYENSMQARFIPWFVVCQSHVGTSFNFIISFVLSLLPEWRVKFLCWERNPAEFLYNYYSEMSSLLTGKESRNSLSWKQSLAMFSFWSHQ